MDDLCAALGKPLGVFVTQYRYEFGIRVLAWVSGQDAGYVFLDCHRVGIEHTTHQGGGVV